MDTLSFLIFRKLTMKTLPRTLKQETRKTDTIVTERRNRVKNEPFY